LREPLVDVLNENPMYGYRRVEPELKARGYSVGETVVWLVLQIWDVSFGAKEAPTEAGGRNALGGRNERTGIVTGALHRLHGDLVCTRWEEGALHAPVESHDEVGNRLVGRASSEHGARVAGSLHGPNNA